uniref:Uncharacterized protein n=1 Tax=Steinernema glaseri TaxID=37863 RepID=A0A1I7YVE2_9BILA
MSGGGTPEAAHSVRNGRPNDTYSRELCDGEDIDGSTESLEHDCASPEGAPKGERRADAGPSTSSSSPDRAQLWRLIGARGFVLSDKLMCPGGGLICPFPLCGWSPRGSDRQNIIEDADVVVCANQSCPSGKTVSKSALRRDIYAAEVGQKRRRWLRRLSVIVLPADLKSTLQLIHLRKANYTHLGAASEQRSAASRPLRELCAAKTPGGYVVKLERSAMQSPATVALLASRYRIPEDEVERRSAFETKIKDKTAIGAQKDADDKWRAVAFFTSDLDYSRALLYAVAVAFAANARTVFCDLHAARIAESLTWLRASENQSGSLQRASRVNGQPGDNAMHLFTKQPSRRSASEAHFAVMTLPLTVNNNPHGVAEGGGRYGTLAELGDRALVGRLVVQLDGVDGQRQVAPSGQTS